MSLLSFRTFRTLCKHSPNIKVARKNQGTERIWWETSRLRSSARVALRPLVQGPRPAELCLQTESSESSPPSMHHFHAGRGFFFDALCSKRNGIQPMAPNLEALGVLERLVEKVAHFCYTRWLLISGHPLVAWDLIYSPCFILFVCLWSKFKSSDLFLALYQNMKTIVRLWMALV